jgi:hypothetical protein
MSNKRRRKVSRPLTMSLMLIIMLLIFLICHIIILMFFYVLMRNKFEKIIVLLVGPHQKRSKICVWVPKCLVTNLKGPNQTWVPKIKA